MCIVENSFFRTSIQYSWKLSMNGWFCDHIWNIDGKRLFRKVLEHQTFNDTFSRVLTSFSETVLNLSKVRTRKKSTIQRQRYIKLVPFSWATIGPSLESTQFEQFTCSLTVTTCEWHTFTTIDGRSHRFLVICVSSWLDDFLNSSQFQSQFQQRSKCLTVNQMKNEIMSTANTSAFHCRCHWDHRYFSTDFIVAIK